MEVSQPPDTDERLDILDEGLSPAPGEHGVAIDTLAGRVLPEETARLRAARGPPAQEAPSSSMASS